VVDEYQDVNPVQHELLAQLRPGVRTLAAVGDEDQAIYGWRHADVQGILRFHRTFPGAETIKLEETYRSSKHILRAARALVRHNEDRIDKRLRTAMPAGERPTCYGAADEVDEADWIAGEIGRLAAREGRPLSDFAVLYRVNAQSRAIEDALVRAGLPYAIHGGSRFYERREVGHALAYLRLALDAADDDATLYLLRDIPGVGPRRVETFRRLARPGDAPLADVLAGGRAAEVAPGRVGEDVRRTALNIQAIRGSRHLSLAEVTGRAVRLTLADWEARGAADPAGVEENLHELRSLAEEFSLRRGSLRTFLDRLILRGEDVPDRPGVTCMSLHAAKGTEYHVVFLAGLEEGLLPHRRSLDARETIEEERRLCYVGMTRARERLLLSYAHFRLLGGQALVGRRSRFLGEIGTNNLIQRASRRLAATPRLPSVLPGQRVVHVRWREGTVVEVEGSGRETMVTIDFDEVGQRRLQLCYAPLTAPATRRRETRVG
ncbi:MAG: UvrD-helicase domain-containing protein, partial [Chloroflexi bacterium]|nr:UvrD-helicase domain-containing protein [Chloroflexota bacterium]